MIFQLLHIGSVMQQSVLNQRLYKRIRERGKLYEYWRKFLTVTCEYAICDDELIWVKFIF